MAGKVRDMSRLPFVVQPKREAELVEIGSDESGKISILRKGYLTTGEKAFMQQAIGNDETTLKIISISRHIAADNGIPLDSAYADTVAILGGRGSIEPRLRDIETKYMEDFTDLMTLLTNMQTKEKLISALCLLKYRVNDEIDINDVLTLHPDIIDGLSELYSLEERKSLENLTSNQPKKEESDDTVSEEAELTAEEVEKKPSRRRSQT
jgi:hypothetical protein